MDNSTIKRLAIQCGIDPDFFQGGELEKFAKSIENEYVKHFKWVNPEIPSGGLVLDDGRKLKKDK